tara:strand:- start:18 stop:617 length:600 start_codon:yes stop_codon:yes gene_type:complete
MPCNIQNNSQRELPELESMITSYYPYAKKRLGFEQDAGIVFLSDPLNARKALGKTGYYDPSRYEISVYVDKRHPKDIMRSVSHELVHHAQNCRGEFEEKHEMGEGYAQVDFHLRNMEIEAYMLGSGIVFRDWEDSVKTGNDMLNEWYEHSKENKIMKESKEKTLKPQITTAKDYYKAKNQKIYDQLMKKFIKKGDKKNG